MLIDAIHEDQKNSTFKAQTILEIGCGSGVPIVFLAKLLPNSKALATDINPNALAFTQKTAESNGVQNLEVIECDLASTLLDQHEQAVDVVIFNPPYVPTPDDEVAGNGIEASWAGGEKGRRVIDRAIPQICRLISK